MSLADELGAECGRIFREQWKIRDGRVVPVPTDLALTSNDAVHLDRATVLYADLSDSTKLVDQKAWTFSAEVYQSFLYCAGRIIRNAGGSIVAYDGDRIMAIFLGDFQSTSAAKCALQINYAVKNIINPALARQYPAPAYQIKHVVGIDTSELHAVRTGVRGGNDIVWVGRAANHAAKLTALDHDYSTWITDTLFKRTADSSKYGGNPRRTMWEARTWTTQNNMLIHRSNWWWKVD